MSSFSSSSESINFEADVLVPDTSALIEGAVSDGIESYRYVPSSDRLLVIVPEAALSELEYQSNMNRAVGMQGLSEIQKLQKMKEDDKIDLQFAGDVPKPDILRNAKSGAVDHLIRNTALAASALFITCDRVQAEVGKARGLIVDLVAKKREPASIEDLYINRFFDSTTMSVHLKNATMPMAKKGSVGNVSYVPIQDERLTPDKMKLIQNELLEFAEFDPDSFVEIKRDGATVLQIRNMRILINEPPFSDDFEITVARPVAQVNFEKYNADEELTQRILQKRGILLAGAPGAGKSTFAAAVAKFLCDHKKVVKTMESPRDLQVPPEITQYGALMGKMEYTAELLLLVRPDYTVYDEVRKTSDFVVFADMRLAGVGMIGVVHATRAIDAVQRLIGRIDLGVIPQVVDTVIFIEKGEIKKVYELEFKVKIPYGMIEEDLARPVVTVADMRTKQVEYEIYTFGEQVVVMPIHSERYGGTTADYYPSVTENDVYTIIEDYIRGPAQVEILSDRNVNVYVRPSDKKKIIGRGGSTINLIERSLGVHVDVRDLAEYNPQRKQRQASRFSSSRHDELLSHSDETYASEYENPQDITDAYIIPIIEKTRKHTILRVPELAGKEADIFIDSEFVFSGSLSRTGDMKLRSDSEESSLIMRAARDGKLIYAKQSEF